MVLSNSLIYLKKLKNNINEYVKNLYFDKNFCKKALASQNFLGYILSIF